MQLKKLGLICLSATLILTSLTGCLKQEPEASETPKEPVVTETDNTTNYEDYFVTTNWLNNNLDNPDLIILDARGDEAYAKGHIPGARSVSWQSLSNMTAEFATENWGTVTDKEALSAQLASLGLTEDSSIVVYADTQKGWGEDGRILWSLNIAGIKDVKILDGGINVWNDAGLDTNKEAVEVAKSDFELSELDLSKAISTTQLAEEYSQYKVIDTRDFDEYEGAQKFGEARGGHLPNALWISYKDLLKEDGSIKDLATIEQLFEDAGLNKTDKIVTYCTAGIRSAHFAVILDMLGYESVANYDDSYYVWANDPTLQIGKVVKEKAYNYYTADHLKAAVENNQDLTIVDIQVADEYKAHHIKGSVETNAYPVKTDEEKALLQPLLETIQASDAPVVIVCPRGGGGAERNASILY